MSTNSGKGSSTIILTQANVEQNDLKNSLFYQFPVQSICQTVKLELFLSQCIIVGQILAQSTATIASHKIGLQHFQHQHS